MNAEKEIMGASTRLLVLASLAHHPTYGYDLLRRINREAAGLFTWREGTLYPVLHRLESEGHLRAQWQESDAQGPGRKYYYITAQGRRTLSQSATQWNAFSSLITRLTGALHAHPTPALD